MNARAKISSKGQLVIPKSVRDAHGWDEGTELEFVEAGSEVSLRTARKSDPRFPPTTWEELRKHRIKYDGPPVSIEDMNKAVLEEAARRWDAKNR
jgi:AbrB family looped-hinge helix DNA binding protein